jgi:hypothetical protein
VTVRVELDAPLAELTNLAIATSATDDPTPADGEAARRRGGEAARRRGGEAEATVTVVVAASEIPALGPAGVVLLALLLAGAAAWLESRGRVGM